MLTPFPAGHLLGGAVWRIGRESDVALYAVNYNHANERCGRRASPPPPLPSFPRASDTPTHLHTPTHNYTHTLIQRHTRKG
jgi:Cft2 family RNA processing exonuclease